MKYLLQVYFNGAQDRLAELPDVEREATVQEYVAFFHSPEIADGNQLQPPATAATIRIHNGKLTRTAEPHDPSAESLGGYYLVEATDIDHALTIAARIPALRMGGAVEVRPVVER
jgi:hypothetical protein